MIKISKKSDLKIDYNQYKNIQESVIRHDNLQFDPTIFFVHNDSDGTYISLLPNEQEVVNVPADFTYEKIENTIITIYGGTVVVGSTEYSVESTNLTITSDCYIGWEFNFTTKSLTIVNFGSVVAQDDNHIRQKLYHIKYITGDNPTISIDRDCHKSVSYSANWGDY